MRTMYDSVNSSAIPANATMVAGYVDGDYAWTTAEWARHSKAAQVKISINGSGNAGDVLDVETGDATPAETAGWIGRRKAAGVDRPTIYCSKATIPAVREATGAYVLGKDYDIWVADWTLDGDPHEVTAPAPGAPVACAATQYESTPFYDLTAVYDDGWPHRTATSGPAPSADLWPAGVTLQLGSQGTAVEALQYALRDCGITGVRGITVDGDFGQQTQTAVRNYQSAEKLSVDGVAGPQTRASLIAHGFMTSAGEGK